MSQVVLRDADLELRVIRDILQHSSDGLGRYDDSGITADSFSHPIYRAVFLAASDVAVDGKAVHALSVSQAAASDELDLAKLSRLEGDHEPRLDTASLRKVGDRLNAMAKGQRLASLLETGLERLRKQPEAATEIGEHIAGAVLHAQESEADDTWPDDVEVARFDAEAAYLVRPAIPAHGLTTIFSPPGHGKTFIAIASACAATVEGANWCGVPVERHGPVLYLGAEGRGSLADRVNAWKLAHGIALTQRLGIRFETNVPAIDDDKVLARLLPRVRRLRPVLVVIDTLARHFSGESENDSACMSRFVRACDRIRIASGGAVVILHHSGKDASSGERGSTALRGAMDSMISVSKTDGLITLTCEKVKDAEEWPAIQAQLRPFGRSVAALGLRHQTTDQVPANASYVLRRLVETFGLSGAKSSQELLSVLNLRQATFYRARTWLLDQGLIEARGTSIKPTITGYAEGQQLMAARDKPRENPTPFITPILTGGEAA